jgi:hypothetical protein
MLQPSTTAQQQQQQAFGGKLSDAARIATACHNTKRSSMRADLNIHDCMTVVTQNLLTKYRTYDSSKMVKVGRRQTTAWPYVTASLKAQYSVSQSI